jgi:hypothetical protein
MIDTPIIAAMARPNAATATPVRLNEAARNRAESSRDARSQESKAAQNGGSDCRNRQQQQEKRDESSEQTPIRKPDDGAGSECEPDTDAQEPTRSVDRALLYHRATQAKRRRAVGHFDGRHGSRDQRGSDARTHGLRDREARHDDFVHRHDEVQIVDRSRNESHELAAYQRS